MNEDSVSLVIPGRNCAKTIEQCLSAVVPTLNGGRLREIVFVDDGSTDGSADAALKFPVTLIRGTGRGPGAARNLGWRAARHPLIWFIDADCVAEPDALDRLLPQMSEPSVGGVSGSYGIMNPGSLLADLIHEEIVERHRRMPLRVNFLATFNVVYRRAVLDEVGGFDERFLKAQDAELAFRVLNAGYELRFVLDSRVRHFHPDRWLPYLRTQRQQGYWRVRLHLLHRGHAAGDSYSQWPDHIQPLLAVLALAAAPLPAFGWPVWILLGPPLLLAGAQLPMTVRLIRRTKQFRYAAYAVMGFIRAFWRGIGMLHGIGSTILRRAGGNND